MREKALCRAVKDSQNIYINSELNRPGGKPMFWCIAVGLGVAGAVYGFKVLNSNNTEPVCPYIGDSACSGKCAACSVESNRKAILRSRVKN